MRAQGATEYLVLLAVVLIIALVSVALLDFFPGVAGEAKNTQSESYWQSASPIAVVGGAGYDTARNDESTNGVKLVLRNNGADPIELLAVSTDKPSGGMTDPKDTDNFKSAWAYFSPEYAPDRVAFSDYVAPPQGTGFGDYTHAIVLAPGETVTVGFSIYSGGSGGAPYNPQICKLVGQDSAKQMELPALTFFYRSIVDGSIGLEKKQYGSKPLSLTCIPGDTS